MVVPYEGHSAGFQHCVVHLVGWCLRRTRAVVVASIPTSLWQSRRNPTLRLGMQANDHQE